MAAKSKRFKEILKLTEGKNVYSLEDALDLLLKCPGVKFDESVDVSLQLGVDPKKSDQQVRGTVSLPHGTGKTMVVIVLAKGNKITEAKEAGADYAGAEELVEKIKGGWTDFNAVIATPDMMREVGKLGKVLGPRGLMPTPKAGTVTTDVANAVKEVKAGKIEFKVDKNSVVNTSFGKKSFSKANLLENLQTFLQAVVRAKPSTAKGIYLKNLALSTTMGPGLKIDTHSIAVQ
jgi:large subunit ribosomal protein L1